MALVSCPECKQSISDSAATCPHCGYPIRKAETPKPAEPFKLGCVGISAIAFAVIMIGGYFAGNSDAPVSSGAEVRASLADKKSLCIQNVTELEKLGTVRIVDRGDFAVMQQNERIWVALSHDDKVRQGLLVYCAKMPASGKYSVLIKGMNSGENLGSVIDGNYWD